MLWTPHPLFLCLWYQYEIYGQAVAFNSTSPELPGATSMLLSVYVAVNTAVISSFILCQMWYFCSISISVVNIQKHIIASQPRSKTRDLQSHSLALLADITYRHVMWTKFYIHLCEYYICKWDVFISFSRRVEVTQSAWRFFFPSITR